MRSQQDNPAEIEARRRLIHEAKARKLQSGSVQEGPPVPELDRLGVDPIPCARTRKHRRPPETDPAAVIAYRLTVERVVGPTETVVISAVSPTAAEQYALRSSNRLRVLASEPVTLAEYRAEFGSDRNQGGRPARCAPAGSAAWKGRGRSLS